MKLPGRHALSPTPAGPVRDEGVPASNIPHTKHLRPFLEVVRQGSLARASEELRRAQSAVSRSIHELETWLGVELFERTARRWLLTEAGRILCHRVELAFRELGDACDDLCCRYPGATARLRIAPFFTLSVHERRLDLLFAFVERKHISAAASLVGISQPAASMALQELEAGVGVPLFDRAHSGVALTEPGEILLAHVKRALTQLRLATDEISALKGVIEGLVVVGALPYSRSHLLPTAIGQVLGEHPGIRVRTVEASLESLTTSLQLGDVDFLVGAMPSDAPAHGLVLEQLGQQSMVVLTRKEHPLAQHASLQLEDVLQAQWVLPREGSPTREALSSCLAQQALLEPQTSVESSDLSVIRGLLLEAGMVTAASPQLFAHEVGSGTLSILPVELPGTERSIGVLSRLPENASPATRVLIEAIRSVFQKQPTFAHIPQVSA